MAPWTVLLRILLVDALLTTLRPVNAQRTAGCDSEDELLASLRWLRSSCLQETFDDTFTLVPATITMPGCATVARRVASECGWVLESSPWFESRKLALHAAVDSAAHLPDDTAAAYSFADPSPAVVHTCGATLLDGFDQFPSTLTTGQARLTIDVGLSHGNVRLNFEQLALDTKANDNLRAYSDTEEHEQVRAIFAGDLPLAGPIDIPGGFAVLLLVSDGPTRHTSLRASVECVCEDSEVFEDADGDGCSEYAQGPKHSLCASMLEPSNEAARSACPVACGACEPDICASSPCLNGGTCTQGGDSATCTMSDLAERTADVTAECCDEPAEDCSSGQPASCNAGCASVLIPYYLDCYQALEEEGEGYGGDGLVLQAVQSAVEQCASTQLYWCSCVDGYSSGNCEVRWHCFSCRLLHSEHVLAVASCPPVCLCASLW